MDDGNTASISEFLVVDSGSNEYPYLTALLLFRAGLHQEALWSMQQSRLEHVRVFGEQIYSKYLQKYGGKLPQEEIENV